MCINLWFHVIRLNATSRETKGSASLRPGLRDSDDWGPVNYKRDRYVDVTLV